MRMHIAARQSMRKLLRIDAELDAFLLDCYPDVRRKMTSSMDRVAKENILLESIEDTEALIIKIREWSSEVREKFVYDQPSIQTESTKVSIRELLDLQKWIIKTCLIAITVQTVFFIVAPYIGFPMEAHNAFRLLEIVLPVFLLYLGGAAIIFFRKKITYDLMSDSTRVLLSLMSRGPMAAFLLITFSSIAMYWYSNSELVPIGNGISIDTLAGIISISLGLLVVSSNAVVMYLFNLSEE